MKPIWKWLIGVTLLIGIGAFVGIWYVSQHWKPILKKQLPIFVGMATDNLYQLTYDDLDFNWATGNASIKNVLLIPDTSVYRQMRVDQNAPDNLYTIKIEQINIKDFHPRQLYSERKLTIRDLVLINPEITIVNDHLGQKDSVKKEVKTPYQRISKVLKKLSINSTQLKNLRFTYLNKSTQIPKQTALRNINITISDFLIDSLSQNDTSRYYHAGGLQFNMDKYRIATGDSLYYVDINGINFSTRERELSIDTISLKSRYSKADFYKKVEQGKERVEMQLDSFKIKNIDINHLLKEQKLHAGRIHSSNGSLEVYNNTNYKRIRRKKERKDPQTKLLELAWNFKVDTLSLENFDVVYEELSRKNQQTGRISFNKTNAQFYNLTNDSVSISENKTLHAKVSTRLMNAGVLDADFKFNLNEDFENFSYEGKLHSMNGRALNPILQPLAAVEIKSANIRRLAFNFNATKTSSKGLVNMRYDDLKINVLLEGNEDKVISKNKLVSGLINVLILNESNPDADQKFIKGNVLYKRPMNASLINYMWRSIFEGIKKSVGVDKARENRLKSDVKKTQKAVRDVGGFIKGVFKKKDTE